MAHEARANANQQQTTAALMRLDVPYLKNFVEGFPFDAIDLNTNTRQLHSLFDSDPELHEVLRDIQLHILDLLKRYGEILPDDWEDGEELDYGELVVLVSHEVDPVLPCINDDLASLEELANTFEENVNILMDELLRDEFLHNVSVDLAKRLNSGIQRLLNAEIIPLVFLLREEKLDQERCLKLKNKPQV